MEQTKTINEIEEIVYRGYGPHQRKGGGFSTLGVKSVKEYEEALKDGWFKTLPAAIDAHDKKVELPVKEKTVTVEEVNVVAPVEIANRASLEAQAKSINLRFHPNISDEKLRLRIESAKGFK